ncbi:MAG: hypothetical protein KBB94_01325 [Legionellaceae bacterium]|nr:hypothetical protein [Legionellaceae bacterium]MBP9774655.1 hypothetical protein [Legionellaceae bacterium]
MPSQALTELSAQIESQKTDSFGKFYLYATLLKKLTIRDRQQSFFDTMPVYSNKLTVGYTTTSIKAGNLDSTFNAMVTNYQSQFDVKVPNFILTIQRIFLFFLRKGQLSDLAFIIDKMNDHLSAEPMAEESYNASIYSNSSFYSRKRGLQDLLRSAQDVSKLVQDSVDNTMYAVITIIAAILSLKITMLLGGLLLTLAMLAASGFATYTFLQTAVDCFDNIGKAADACEVVGKSLYLEQAGNIMTPDYLSFIINGVLKPIVFANVTVREQMAVDMDEYMQTQRVREAADREFLKLT